MKFSTIALAGALAITSSTFALAQAGGANAGGAAMPENSGPATNAQGDVVNRGSMNRGTTGMGSGSMGTNRRMDSGNPNGDPGGPTSLSGTGSSQFGGSVPGNTGKN